MDKVSKFLLKLTREERERVIPIMRKIVSGSIDDLDCKKLKGKPVEFRVRVGKVRIKFLNTERGNMITSVGFRNESTY